MMKDRLAVFWFLFILFGCGLPKTNALDDPGPYEVIPIKPVLDQQRITRPDSDRVLVGQILSESGAEQFRAKYGVTFKTNHIDFEKQMLVFGITDIIYTRAFQLLRNRHLDTAYILDYYNAGIYRDLPDPGKGKKYSIVQVFVTRRDDKIIRNVEIKNLHYEKKAVFGR